MICNVKLYKNTGFNSINLPSSDKVIDENFTPFYQTDFNLVQTGSLQKIRINLTYLAVCDCDYVSITNTELFKFYFTVEQIEMLAEDVAELYLLIDPIATIGGFQNNPKCNIVYAIANRMHVKDDVYGKYTLPENEFVPNEPLELELSQQLGEATGGGYMAIVMCTAFIAPDEKSAVQLKPSSGGDGGEGSEDPVLLLPKLVDLPAYTNFKINGVGTGSLSAGLCGFVGDTTKQLAKRLREFGVDNAIVSSYVIPTSYMGATTGKKYFDTTYIEFIDAKKIETQVTNLTIVSNAINQKCNIGNFNKMVLMSNCSGEQIEVLPEDVVKNGSVVVKIIADLRYEGKPTATFKNYKNYDSDKLFMQSVSGLQWQNYPIIFTGKSGEAVERFNFKANQEYEKNAKTTEAGGKLASGILGGAVTAGVGIATGNIGAVVGGAMEGLTAGLNYANTMSQLEKKQNLEKAQFQRSLYYTQPQINFPISGSVRDAFGNGFYVAKYKLSQNDLKQFDNYLTLFGYNVGSKKIDASDFYSRQHYNYIKLNDIELHTVLIPKFIKENAEERLKLGVRLWHTQPNSEYCVAGGNNIK